MDRSQHGAAGVLTEAWTATANLVVANAMPGSRGLWISSERAAAQPAASQPLARPRFLHRSRSSPQAVRPCWLPDEARPTLRLVAVLIVS